MVRVAVCVTVDQQILAKIKQEKLPYGHLMERGYMAIHGQTAVNDRLQEITIQVEKLQRANRVLQRTLLDIQESRR